MNVTGRNNLDILFFGLSALAERPMDSCSSVRASVAAYLENRASDFDDFLHKATS